MLQANGETAPAQRLLAQCVAWIDAAASPLPAPYRQSFLERNDTNRRALSLARRTLRAAP